MRIAVINEVSAAAKNADIIAALEAQKGVEVLNLGMRSPDDGAALTYIHTGLMAAVILNDGLCDLVVGGCGTGQGFINSVMQYPGVFCGLLADPLDAWLFSQINNGNCVSLVLNKGYGWAGGINLELLFAELFRYEPGRGYPPERSESQAQSRETLHKISAAIHLPMPEIIRNIDADILAPIFERAELMEFLRKNGGKDAAAELLKRMEESL